MEKPGSFDHFPKETECTPWFFRISADTKLNCAFNNSGINSKKNNNKKSHNFAFFKGYIYNASFLSTDAPLYLTWQILGKTIKLKSQYLNLCLIYRKP